MNDNALKCLIINGSPRAAGNSRKIFIDPIRKLAAECEPRAETEVIELNQPGLKTCTGCQRCMVKGESFCPLRDERNAILEKMLDADCLCFVTPVHLLGTSWAMRNFFSRFIFLSDRPRIFEKPALLFASANVLGTGSALKELRNACDSWGFRVIASFGVTVRNWEKSDRAEKKLLSGMRRAFKKNAPVFAEKKEKPSMTKLIGFFIKKYDILAHNAADEVDYRYWKERGWLEKRGGAFRGTLKLISHCAVQKHQEIGWGIRAPAVAYTIQ